MKRALIVAMLIAHATFAQRFGVWPPPHACYDFAAGQDCSDII